MTSEITTLAELDHFIKEHASDHYALQLILFFADHPYAQFNELAIIHAVSQDGGRRCIQQALRDLVGKRIIKTWIDSKVTLYSLLENMRNLALELAKLDMRQHQLLLRQTCPDSLGKGGRLFRDVAAEVLSQIPKAAVTDRQNSAIFNQAEQMLNENVSLACSEINQEPVANATSNL